METYPGGRYLELDRTATGIYDIDFNRAFHPFCFYNPTYDCPYPPRGEPTEDAGSCRRATTALESVRTIRAPSSPSHQDHLVAAWLIKS